MKEFEVYSWGLLYASACTSLDPKEAEERINREMPSGTTLGWIINDGPFSTGEPNPTPCDQNPETHKHVLFSC